MRWLLMLGIVAACGRYGFDLAKGDTMVDGDAMVDGHAGDVPDTMPASCTFGSWQAPMNLGLVNGRGNDWSPTLSDDGLELLFETTRDGNQQLYRAVRATPTDAFGAPVPLTELNSPQADASPSLSRDRLTVYFSSNRSGNWRLYRATRADKVAAFGAPVLVPELASVDVLGPAISASGDELVYNDLSESRISRAVLMNGTFMVVGVMTELGTSASAYPDLSSDGLTIYFDTNSSRIESATRSAPGAAFSMPSNLIALDSGGGEADADLGFGDRQIVFSSDRAGGEGGWDIWTATRSCD